MENRDVMNILPNFTTIFQLLTVENGIMDIKSAVKEAMQTILVEAYKGEVCEDDVRKRLFPVGSMEEGTKVGKPDEFDFTFAVPDYDYKSICFDDKFAETDLDFVTFFVHRQAEYTHLSTKDETITTSKLSSDFLKRIRVGFKPVRQSEKFEIRRPTGTLQLNKELGDDAFEGQQGPAFRFDKCFIWTKYSTNNAHDVSVDLAPVIRPKAPGEEHFLEIQEKNFFVPFKAKEMIKRLYLVNDSNETYSKEKKSFIERAFVKTFVLHETERVKKMESEHPQWFKCYVLMKYFTGIKKDSESFTFEENGKGSKLHIITMNVKIPDQRTDFSSYNWKTMILSKVKGKDNCNSVSKCFSILTEPLLPLQKEIQIPPESLQPPHKVEIAYLGNPLVEEIIYTRLNGKNTPTAELIIEIKQILEKVSNDEMTYEEFKKEIKQRRTNYKKMQRNDKKSLPDSKL